MPLNPPDRAPRVAAVRSRAFIVLVAVVAPATKGVPCGLVSEGAWEDGDWIVEYADGSKFWSNLTNSNAWAYVGDAGKANPKAVSWESRSGCQIQPRFEEAFAGRRTVFMGDSQMAHVFLVLMKNTFLSGGGSRGWYCKHTRRKDISARARGNDTWWDYLQLPRPEASDHLPPAAKCDSEVDGKTGCSACMPETIVCSNNAITPLSVAHSKHDPSEAGLADAVFEFLPVEYARDSEVTVFRKSTTTQQTIFNVYFADPANAPDSVVALAGHHDMFLWGHKHQRSCRAGTLERYDAATRSYAQLMAKFAERRRAQTQGAKDVRMLWLSMSQVLAKLQPEHWKEASDNKLVWSMNNVSLPHFQAAGVKVLEVKPIAENLYSQKMLHEEAIHINGQDNVYYKQLAAGIAHDLALMGMQHKAGPQAWTGASALVGAEPRASTGGTTAATAATLTAVAEAASAPTPWDKPGDRSRGPRAAKSLSTPAALAPEAAFLEAHARAASHGDSASGLASGGGSGGAPGVPLGHGPGAGGGGGGAAAAKAEGSAKPQAPEPDEGDSWSYWRL